MGTPEDDPFPQPAQTTSVKSEPVENFPPAVENAVGPEVKSESSLVVKSEYSYVLPESEGKTKVETNEDEDHSLDDKKTVFSQTNAMISRIRSNTAARNYNIAPGPLLKKRPQSSGKQKSRISSKKHVSSKPVPELFASRKAQEEIRTYEELKNVATAELNSLYDEIRPVIEEHERDNQDNISTSVAEKWMQATCAKWKAEFDFHFSIVKNVICPSNPNTEEAKPATGGELIEN